MGGIKRRRHSDTLEGVRSCSSPGPIKCDPCGFFCQFNRIIQEREYVSAETAKTNMEITPLAGIVSGPNPRV